MTDLADALNSLVAAAVRRELERLLPMVQQAVTAAQRDQGHVQPRRWLTLQEALKSLPHGCRTERMLDALRNGALRGRQEDFGRRCWLIDVDDLPRWDAAGRPPCRNISRAAPPAQLSRSA
jgi:hypothetical protein